MKIIFAGTPSFAVIALQAILDANFEVSLVLSQPDRPNGRGLKLTPNAVKQIALKNGLPIAQPTSLKLDGIYSEQAKSGWEAIHEAQADIMVVAAYGLILPEALLNQPKHGSINIHASLLPRWRGAAPIHRAIEAGDEQTGITLMQMDAGLDTGAMLSTHTVTIGQHAQASLHNELAQLGAKAVVGYLHSLRDGVSIVPIAQPRDGVTYAHKIQKEEAHLNWNTSALILERKIRAFNPNPATAAKIDAETHFKIYAAQIVHHEPHSHPVGLILNVDKNGIDVACAQGVLRITEAQRSGGKRLPVAQFINGLSLNAGQVLL